VPSNKNMMPNKRVLIECMIVLRMLSTMT
jgi:hypothetical protein